MEDIKNYLITESANLNNSDKQTIIDFINNVFATLDDSETSASENYEWLKKTYGASKTRENLEEIAEKLNKQIQK